MMKTPTGFNHTPKPEIYWLAGDDWEEGFSSLDDLVNSELVWEAFTVFQRQGDNGIIDMVEECAHLWWHTHGEVFGNLPPVFKYELSTIQQNAQDAGETDPNAEHSTYHRGIGI